ncbi:hypothetical protein Sste5346_005095 [Sporothrix stenoceras]|uniref:Acyltransferase 3 domain-containing protein n=1 Tax=Sporothrix stenoceras TaxID=5173 RepID=A0ABR3Z4S0_9PEZI
MASGGLLNPENLGASSSGLPYHEPNRTTLEKNPAPPAKSIVWKIWDICTLNDGASTAAVRRDTAYLDGLRGFAAFLVYIHHNELWAHAASPHGDNEYFENAYGFKGKHFFATLPFVRNFFTGGHIAVAIFYVISGYVLCAKPLGLIIDKKPLALLDNLASSVFRRWFRLYIPIFATTFAYAMSWHIFGHYWVSNSKQHASVWEEIWEWYVELKNFTFLFKEGSIWVSMNTHLWSIPFEMRGSMICFMTMLATYRATHFARHVCMIALAWYFLYIVDGYYCCMFMVGVYFCYLDLLAKRNDAGFPSILRKLQPYKMPLAYGFFALGMFLAGVPSQKNDLMLLRSNPYWYYLSFLKPQAVFDPKWFFLVFAAGMIVGTVPHIPILKSAFETRFCQYLGRISYSLYLVHGPVLASIGDRVYAMTGWYRVVEDHDKMLEWWINRFQLPKTGPMGLEINFLAPQIIIFPVTFILANLVTKYIDEPAVRWPAKLYKWVCGPGNESEHQPAPAPAQRASDPQRRD